MTHGGRVNKDEQAETSMRNIGFVLLFLVLTLPIAGTLKNIATRDDPVADAVTKVRSDRQDLEMGQVAAMLLVEGYVSATDGTENPFDISSEHPLPPDPKLGLNVALKAKRMWIASGVDRPDVAKQFDQVIDALYAANYYIVANEMHRLLVVTHGSDRMRAAQGEMEARRLSCEYSKKSTLHIDLPREGGVQSENFETVCNEL